MRLLRSVLAAVVLLTFASPVARSSPLTAQGVAPCTVSQLAGGVFWQGAAGSLAGPLVVENVGNESCSLPGQPTIALADGNEQPLAVQFAVGDRPGVAQTGVVVQPGDEAAAMLFWRNWCGDPPAGGVYVFLTLESETVAVSGMNGRPLSGTPRCDSPLVAGDPTSGISTLTVAAWTPYPPQ